MYFSKGCNNLSHPTKVISLHDNGVHAVSDNETCVVISSDNA